QRHREAGRRRGRDGTLDGAHHLRGQDLNTVGRQQLRCRRGGQIDRARLRGGGDMRLDQSAGGGTVHVLADGGLLVIRRGPQRGTQHVLGRPYRPDGGGVHGRQ